MSNQDENEQDRNGGGGGGGFVAGFFIGALVGAAVAIVISQEETRDLLVGKAREASNYAMDATGDLRSQVSDAASNWQSNAADLYERGKHVVENAQSNVNAAVDAGKTQADSMRDDLSREANDRQE